MNAHQPRINNLSLQGLPRLGVPDTKGANAFQAFSTRMAFADGLIPAIDICVDPHIPPSKMAEEISVTLREQSFVIRLEQPALGPLMTCGGLQADTEALAGDPELAGMLLEHLLTPALGQIEANPKISIHIESVGRPQDRATDVMRMRFSLRADIWDTPCAGEIGAKTAAGADLLLELFAPVETQGSDLLLELPCCMRVLGPSFQISRADLAALQTGDGLLAATDLRLDHPEFVMFSPRHHAQVAWEDENLVILGFASPAVGTPCNKEIDQMSGFEDDTMTIDDIPVTLSLELDRVELPFSELGELRVGSVVPFQATHPRTVRILANGRAFAFADLVLIEDRIGVRVTSLIQRLT